MSNTGEKQELATNAAGRKVLKKINNNEAVPFQGVGKYKPQARKAAPKISSCSDYPPNGNKCVKDMRTALELCGIHDGMTISTHHHFRNGDLVANHLFDAIAKMGIKDLRWFPSASFPCHAPIISHLVEVSIALPPTSFNPNVSAGF